MGRDQSFLSESLNSTRMVNKMKGVSKTKDASKKLDFTRKMNKMKGALKQTKDVLNDLIRYFTIFLGYTGINTSSGEQ
jgi:hypothetical protein